MENKEKAVIQKYPVTTTASGTALIVWLALQFGVDIPAEVAVELVGLLSLAVAFLTQRKMSDNS